MNAIELLKDDHQRVSEMIGRLESQDSRSDDHLRLGIFEQLKELLQTHTKMEETVFYPALEDKAETRALVEESYREHHTVDEILARLDQLKDEPTGGWQTQLDELKRNVEHHVAEEEGELFPRAELLLSAAELQDMRVEMERVTTHQSELDSLIYPASRLGSED